MNVFETKTYGHCTSIFPLDARNWHSWYCYMYGTCSVLIQRNLKLNLI